MSTGRDGNMCCICIWLGQSLLYTVFLSFVALSESGYPLRDSRLALETGVLRLHGVLRVIKILCPYLGLV
jgi:hypothetical protein